MSKNEFQITGVQDPLAMRPREAARMLGVSLRTLYTWESAGLISAARVGTGKRKAVLFSFTDLKVWLANQLSQAKGGK